MRKWIVLGCLALVGCGPMGLYYKPGVSVAGAERDEITCAVKAERDVPVRNVSRVIPGQWVPGRKICRKPGQCRMTPGHRTPPQIITEDANLALRNKVAALCMKDRGYARISLPPCPPEIEKSVVPAITVTMPKRLSQNACVIRRKNGAFQVVDPG
ncbi:hypothetical protein [Rhodalgimonas zhirmunskyi]|uniref:Lipoprotein n=1 Tax=Rhodalgimonas zhirmunskyi TaxID=2964767 RepID=A0AAJ1U819_9RHOB|nr:hypothetical protein [Rhodoalgimonas zhirmunskyi]MDQ2092818.1 hypothetical protein [Rhodoalgimonas zhirmunskyi]